MRIKNTAFTLLEILLAAIIFVITIGGVFATLEAVRQPVSDKEKALTAAILEKQFLETLRSQVDAGNYSSGVLALTPPNTSVAVSNSGPFTSLDWITIGNGGYALTYTVSCADGTVSPPNCDTDGAARQVTVNATW